MGSERTELGTLTSHSSMSLSSFTEFQSNSPVSIAPTSSSGPPMRIAPRGGSNVPFLLEASVVPCRGETWVGVSTSEPEDESSDVDDGIRYGHEVELRGERGYRQLCG